MVFTLPLKQSVIALEENHQIIRKHMEKKENEVILKADTKEQEDMFLESQEKFNLA